MRIKKRRKSSRRRGTRLCGWAAKKHKGSGNRGGKGMSGSGKQKKTYVIRYLLPYFGREAKKKEKAKRKGEEINLKDIEEKLERFKKEGLAKEGKEGTELNLPGYKVLGDGEVKKKLIVSARAFSGSAKEKIEKVGGKAVIVMPKAEEGKEGKEGKKEKKVVGKKKEIKEKTGKEGKKVGEKVARKEKVKSIKK